MESQKSKTDLDGANICSALPIRGNKTKQNDNLVTVEPKRRVIKQIVSLDVKKLKDLGIESNILSALTKFNVKEKKIPAKKPIKIAHDSPSTSNNIPKVISPTIVLPSVKSALSSPTKQKIEPPTSPGKKVKIISDVLIRLPATSTTNAISELRDTSLIQEKVVSTTDENKNTEKSPSKSTASITALQNNHVEEPSVEDDISGFTNVEFEYAKIQLHDLQHELSSKANRENPAAPSKAIEENIAESAAIHEVKEQIQAERSRLPKKRLRKISAKESEATNTADETSAQKRQAVSERIPENNKDQSILVNIPETTINESITGPITSTPMEQRKRKSSVTLKANRKRKKSNIETPQPFTPSISEIIEVVEAPVEDVRLEEPPKEEHTSPEKPQRGRKPKQTVLRDYFAVRSANLDEKSLDKSEEKPSTSEDIHARARRSSCLIESKKPDLETSTRTLRTPKPQCSDIEVTQEDPNNVESASGVEREKSAETPTKKRGRKSQIVVKVEEKMEEPIIESATTSMDALPEILSENVMEEAPAEPEVPSLAESSTNETFNESVSEQLQSTPGSKRRGRPSKKQIEELKVKEDVLKNTDFVCGNCKANVQQKKWKAHVATHYRLMTKFMKATKIPYFRCPKCSDRKKSALGYISHVDLCGLTPEQSAAMKAECPYCKKLYRKVSLPSHIQGFCPVRRLETIQQTADESIKAICDMTTYDEAEEVVYTESGRPKRIIKKIKSTAKLVDEFIKVGWKITGGVIKGWNGQRSEKGIIKCPNSSCTFTAQEVDEMRSHFIQCRDKIHQCKLCSLTVMSKDEIVEHIEKEHENVLKAEESEPEEDKVEDDEFKVAGIPSSSDDDSYEDDDSTEDKKRKRKGPTKQSGKRNRIIPLSRVMENDSPEYWEMLEIFYKRIMNTKQGYYRLAYEWTKNFTEQHYDQGVLELRNHLRKNADYNRLKPRETIDYLNTLHLESVKFSCQKQIEYNVPPPEVGDDAWKSLNVLENVSSNHVNPETSILYCGGKIMHIDWIPFPSDYTGNQILVTCSHNKDAKLFSPTNCTPAEKSCSLIQLWSVSTRAETEIENVKFLYGIAYDDGPICTMSFCPSDAYIASNRLAILAIPDTSGGINIFSLPETVTKAKSNISNFIKLKPELRLQLTFEKTEKPQTIAQLTWSRTKGHKILCAGYNTGLVAVWNFEHLNSSYMRKQIDGIPVILPKQSFLGALSCITQLDLHTDKDNNARWLLIGALDRKIRLYDLEDSTLMPFTSTLYKSRIISGAWPLHWPIYLTVIDAALTRLGGGMNIKQVLYTNNQSQNTSLLNDSEPSNLSFSDWLNTGIFGNDVGDLFMINFQQLLLHDRNDESSQLKILSVTDIQPEKDNASTPRIIFSDFEETVLAPKTKMRMAPIEIFPFTKINKVAINPNESHKKMYAVGYELGFCRIRFLPVLQKVISVVPGPRPTHIFEVSSSPDSVAEEKFRSHCNELPTIYAYHGSKVESFHSILNYGLQQHLCKTALYGEGIYLSSELHVSLMFSPTGCGWKKSRCGTRISSLAICEFVNHPQHLHYDTKEKSNKSGVPDKYFVITNNEILRLRYLVVYGSENRAASQTANYENRVVKWISNHKWVAGCIGYAAILLIIGVSNSRQGYFFRHFMSQKVRDLIQYIRTLFD